MTTKATKIHLFHGNRQNDFSHEVTYQLAAIVTVPPDVQGEANGDPRNAIDHAYVNTQNISGSWSLKIGADGHPSVQPAGIMTTANGDVMGLRSTMGGDVLIVDGEKVFVLPWLGHARELTKDSALPPEMSQAALRQMLYISQQHHQPLRDVEAVQLATAVASYAAVKNAPGDQFNEAVEQVIKINEGALRDIQIKGIMSVARSVAAETTKPGYEEQVEQHVYKLLDTKGQLPGGGFSEVVDDLLVTLGKMDTKAPAPTKPYSFRM